MRPDNDLDAREWQGDGEMPECQACQRQTCEVDERGRALCPRCRAERDDARSYEIASGGR